MTIGTMQVAINNLVGIQSLLARDVEALARTVDDVRPVLQQVRQANVESEQRILQQVRLANVESEQRIQRIESTLESQREKIEAIQKLIETFMLVKPTTPTTPSSDE